MKKLILFASFSAAVIIAFVTSTDDWHVLKASCDNGKWFQVFASGVGSWGADLSCAGKYVQLSRDGNAIAWQIR